MLTTVSEMTLKEGSEPVWDEAMKERLEAVRARPGWIASQVLVPLDRSNERVVVGTWKSRDDWEEWHRDPAFQATRQRLDQAEVGPRHQWWHEVRVGVQR